MLKTRLLPHIWFSWLFLILGAFFGLLYAVQLLGYGVDLLRPDLARALHLSLMLYGFAPLMLSVLPFALFEKEGVLKEAALNDLERYFFVWYIFLAFLIFSLLSGNTRGLPFYDFPYALNGILALAGLFYIAAIIRTVKVYTHKPLWVKVSLFLVIVSPFALLLLMNPDYGQVEKMLQGPHGDNTLGMSFALLAIYYLAIKQASDTITFSTRWHFLWMVPLGFYALSVFYRSFIGNLSYNAEWFLQYLTLLYLPILYRWWKDARLDVKRHKTLLISILAFLFVDVEGNILFIPQLRELFHRNDLVVGHAHIAVGIGVLFLALAIIEPFFRLSRGQRYYLAAMLIGMGFVLSISGISQAGFISVDIETVWYLRALFGILFFGGLFMGYTEELVSFLKQMTPIRWYHTAGFLSDGIGGLLLLFFGGWIYAVIGAAYHPGYQQIVFGFVTGVGMLHLAGIFMRNNASQMAMATVLLRTITAAGFFALYEAGVLGWIALAVTITDMTFVLVYLTIIYRRETK